MVIHVKIFLAFWGYTIADLLDITCWKCNSNKSVQVAHIDQKGRGGRPSAEYIENYIPLCSKCHTDSEGRTYMKSILWDILVKRILAKYPNHIWSEYFKQTWYYKNYIW